MTTTSLQFRIPRDVYLRLKAIIGASGKSVKDYMPQVVIEHVKAKEKNGAK